MRQSDRRRSTHRSVRMCKLRPAGLLLILLLSIAGWKEAWAGKGKKGRKGSRKTKKSKGRDCSPSKKSCYHEPPIEDDVNGADNIFNRPTVSPAPTTVPTRQPAMTPPAAVLPIPSSTPVQPSASLDSPNPTFAPYVTMTPASTDVPARTPAPAVTPFPATSPSPASSAALTMAPTLASATPSPASDVQAPSIMPFPAITPSPASSAALTAAPTLASAATPSPASDPAQVQAPSITPFPATTPSPAGSPTPSLAPAGAPFPVATLAPTGSPAPSTSSFPSITPVPTSAPTRTAAPSKSSQPTTISNTSLSCTVDDSGSFGAQQGDTRIVQYYFQLETSPDVGQDVVQQEILPLAETRITNLLLPDLFPDECGSARPRRLQQPTRRIVGLSSRPVDIILEGVACPNELVDPVNNCFLVDGAFTLIYLESRIPLTEETVQQLLSTLNERMDSGDLNDIDERVVKITYVNGTGLSIGPGGLAGTGNQGSTDRDGGGIPAYGWAFIVAGAICVLLLLIFYALTRRRGRDNEAEQRDTLLVAGEPAAGELAAEDDSTPPDQVYVDSGLDSDSGNEDDDLLHSSHENEEENDEPGTPHESDVYMSERSDDPVLDTSDILSSSSFASAPTVQISGSGRWDPEGL